jgi:hypothetical protein
VGGRTIPPQRTPRRRCFYKTMIAGAESLAGTVRPLDRAMRYQLVLQFRGDSLAGYDAMVALEGRLIEELGHSAKVDGHDCGSGEANIFIFTSDPAATFCRVRQTLQREGQLDAVTAAYRDVKGESYTVIWPEGSETAFCVT